MKENQYRIPESLANALNLSESEFKYEVKISAIVKLFE
jgi:hypothetical protein